MKNKRRPLLGYPPPSGELIDCRPVDEPDFELPDVKLVYVDTGEGDTQLMFPHTEPVSDALE